MIRSMTGFGKATAQLPIGLVTVEIRSLNSKFLDLNLKLARVVQDREYQFRQLISTPIERGKVTFSVNVERTGKEASKLINESLVSAYYMELKTLSATLGEQNQHLLPIIMRLPEVVGGEQIDDENWWPALELVVNQALTAFDAFRETEGQQTGADMLNCVENILMALSQIDPFEQERIDTIRKRMQNGLDSALDPEQIDKNRFEQELIFYLEKLDISEEKQRLRQHCEYFKNTLNERSGGKKLGFIAQEMGREINTLGSKSNHVEIQKRVVDMKNELEKSKNRF